VVVLTADRRCRWLVFGQPCSLDRRGEAVTRHAKRRDLSEPKIVEALEACGCTVYRKLPVDLLVRVPRDPPGVVRLLECKTPRRTGNWTKDQRQLKQMEDVQVTGTPYVTTAEAALKAVGL
jgi:hypothetical protein